MKLPLKMAFGIVGVAVASAACGNATTAAAKTTTTNPDLAQNVASTYCTPPLPNTAPPKEGSVSDPNGGPTATACWADGLYVGNGSLTDKQIIFADKQVNMATVMVTPQDIRANPTIAEHDFIGTAGQYADQAFINAAWNAMTSAAKAGDIQVVSGKNQDDPTGLVDARFRVNLETPNAGVVRATLNNCVDSQVYELNSQHQPMAGVEGKPGYGAWTDTMQKSSSGWILVGTTATKAVPSCN